MYKDTNFKNDLYNNKNYKKNSNKNIIDNNINSDSYLLSSVEVIEELLNNFFKNQVDKKIVFLLYHNINSKNSCEKVMEIILSKLHFIKLDASKLILYKSPIFFMIKQIIKNLPLITTDDKKVLWDRIFLFLKTFDITLNDNDKTIPSEIVFTQIEFDDPVAYIKNEISDIFRKYNVNQFINVYINNFDLLNYKWINRIYSFMNILFGEFIQFRFIAQVYKIEIIKNLIEKFPGNNDYNQLINFVLNNSYNYFICDETNKTY